MAAIVEVHRQISLAFPLPADIPCSMPPPQPSLTTPLLVVSSPYTQQKQPPHLTVFLAPSLVQAQTELIGVQTTTTVAIPQLKNLPHAAADNHLCTLPTRPSSIPISPLFTGPQPPQPTILPPQPPPHEPRITLLPDFVLFYDATSNIIESKQSLLLHYAQINVPHGAIPTVPPIDPLVAIVDFLSSSSHPQPIVPPDQSIGYVEIVFRRRLLHIIAHASSNGDSPPYLMLDCRPSLRISYFAFCPPPRLCRGLHALPFNRGFSQPNFPSLRLLPPIFTASKLEPLFEDFSVAAFITPCRSPGPSADIPHQIMRHRFTTPLSPCCRHSPRVTFLHSQLLEIVILPCYKISQPQTFVGLDLWR
ncbi:hypothetical protein Salat_0882300 [Sesamum alatum]|uniref:Uncharacterized protein n=1 Tax=Sesamum alatum TaxID=300844 RepID=A0AAE1YJG7_9LAMI|nr:hypothetical protein Salat_0882300 [Sesamum alatum]